MEPEGKRIEVTLMPMRTVLGATAGENLLGVLRRGGLNLVSVCGGKGICGKCLVHVLEGRTSSHTAAEEKFLDRQDLERGMRLACQARVESDSVIYLPPTSLAPEQRFQVDGVWEPTELNPVVKAADVEVRLPDKPGDHGSDLARLLGSLSGRPGDAPPPAVELETLRELPVMLRSRAGKVRAVLRRDKILGIIPREGRVLGVAVDLGSTKVALFVHDLLTGEPLGSRGFLNPQVSFGEDVVSRMQHAMRGEAHGMELSRLVAEGITSNLAEMLAPVGTSLRDVYEVVLVGNTAMHHLFLGLPVKQLAMSPYLPATDLPLEVRAGDLGISLSPSSVVYLPPPIAGYVGSDHLAAVSVTRLAEREGPCLLLDIGTNTEVALQWEGGIVCCSCASGPAFEGMGLSQGMRAGEGAVERVYIDSVTGRPQVSVIGDARPAGICGSGILSALAALLKAGALDESGRLRRGFPGVESRDGETLFRLVPPDEGGRGGVAITQSDIREIQKAKGAIRAGIEALLREARISPAQLKEVILAGAFGSYLDPADALVVAMLPPVPLSIIRQVGNAAGAGARSMLLSEAFRKEAEELAKDVDYLELSTYPALAHLFAASMYLSEEAVARARGRFGV